jgi:hypothetical protein
MLLGKTEDRPNDCPSVSASTDDAMKEYEGDCLRMAQTAAEVGQRDT